MGRILWTKPEKPDNGSIQSMSNNRTDRSSPSNDLSGLGEAGIIEWIRLNGPTREDPRLLQGIGDDCAVLKYTDTDDLLVTIDTMVEGTHFTEQTLPPDALGWKALATNISDVAAMGGTPKTAFLSLGLSRKTSKEFIEAFLSGLNDLAQKSDVVLAGGDTIESRIGCVITLTLIGECPHGRAVYRHGARLQDDVWVTGYPGNSAGGLALLKEKGLSRSHVATSLVTAHQRPDPRLDLGKSLARSNLVHAMIDLSDGISTDLWHVCRQSRVGATIEAATIPISEDLKGLGDRVGTSPLVWALHGGEDYELLFTASKSHRNEIEMLATSVSGIPIHRIGKIVEEAGVSLVTEEGMIELAPGGYSHFSGG